MKKISLLTIHCTSNVGSILQTIATVETMKRHDCDTEVVNYIQERFSWKCNIKKNALSLKALVRLLIVYIPQKMLRNHISKSFLLRYVKVSKPIYPQDDFVKVCPKADIYMTGSDQVWRSIHNGGPNKRYYFDGFPNDAVKIAYAASFGSEKLVDEEEYAEVKRMLGSYKAISVREASAKQLIEDMGYKVTHVLDPTFMLNKEDWQPYMSKRMIKKPYLFVYLPYNPDKTLINIRKTLRKIATEKQLKVVSSLWTLKPDRQVDKHILFASPGDFLSLMYHADYVVTNSFHGTAFSINLNKQFSVYLPSNYGTRITSILEVCGLNNRLLAPNEVISSGKINETIDYALVNSMLEKERQKAHAFLKQALT